MVFGEACCAQNYAFAEAGDDRYVDDVGGWCCEGNVHVSVSDRFTQMVWADDAGFAVADAQFFESFANSGAAGGFNGADCLVSLGRGFLDYGVAHSACGACYTKLKHR